MRNLDFSSLNGALTTLLGLVLVSVVAVGIRLLLMQTIQRRRERENRQINERLRTLIAAYKILGGSFTGELSVDPAHLRALRQTSGNVSLGIEPIEGTTEIGSTLEAASSERRRRIRDAVEAALSDVILLGTEEQVNLAAHAAREMVAGNKVHLSELIISLRNFIRQALDLEPISPELRIPHQGPLRPTVSGGKGSGGGRGEGSDKEGGGRSGSGMAMGAGGVGGLAAGYHSAASEGISDAPGTDGPRS
jgi:type II secretory pathway pseudopilin PulG